MQDSFQLKKNTKIILKEARLAARSKALRQNLLKRKQQTRLRERQEQGQEVLAKEEIVVISQD